MSALQFIINIYILGMILMFILLSIISKDVPIRYTNLKTNQKYDLWGIKKFLAILFLSIIWFYAMIKMLFNKERK